MVRNNSQPPKNLIRNKKSFGGSKPKHNKAFSLNIIVGLLLIVFFVGVYFAFKTIKSDLSSKKALPSKTVYLSAEKKVESAKIYTERADKASNSKASEKSQSSYNKSGSKTDKKNSESSKQVKPQQPSSNSFVKEKPSSNSEWQPINSAIKEATKRFKNLVYGGSPQTKHSVTILENEPYYSAYSETRRNPLWVGYRLDDYKGESRLPRPGGFNTDFRTKAKIDQKVYSKTGYDRGHMCPNSAIAKRYGKKGQLETFLMSNICPQKPNLNRKVWERLERLEEAYANKYNGVYVFTGPIFDEHVEILNKKVEIPDAFFKILIDEEKNKVRVLPFIIPQNVTGKEILNDFLTTVDEIEEKTGLDFFSAMDDNYEALLESRLPQRTLWK